MLELAPEKWTMQGVMWAFLVIGALIAGGGLMWTAHTAWFLARAPKTTGLVVDVIAVRSTSNPGDSPHAKQTTSYYPVVEFQDELGTRRQAKSTRAARSDHFKRGDAVSLSFDAKDPTQALIHDRWILWFSPGVILAGGLLWVMVVGAMLVFVKRFDAGFAADKERFLRRMPGAGQIKE